MNISFAVVFFRAAKLQKKNHSAKTFFRVLFRVFGVKNG
jgi:hypothetical protein